MPVQTAATMTELPGGGRPEEFLRDEDLVGFYERQLEALDEDDPKRAKAAARVRAAKRAALSVAASVAEYEAMAAAEIAAVAAEE